MTNPAAYFIGFAIGVMVTFFVLDWRQEREHRRWSREVQADNELGHFWRPVDFERREN